MYGEKKPSVRVDIRRVMSNNPTKKHARGVQWHCHPVGPKRPTKTFLERIKEVVQEATNPLLMLFGRTKDGYPAKR